MKAYMSARHFVTTAGAAMLLLASGAVAGVEAQTTATGADPLFKLDPNTRRQVEVLRDSAVSLGLPARQLVLKALEGNAKKKDPKIIVGAVRALFTQMKVARAALGTTNEGELVAAASALNDKVTPDDLTQFKSFSRGRSPVTAFTALADVIEQGVARDDAVTTVLRLWKGGSNDDDLQGLLRLFSQDVHSGITPANALLQRARDLPVRPPGPPDQPETL
jgi:hypothetical protein